MKKIGICRAHTNIALIKYWGKRNEALFLPMNSSLSLTLDAFYTDTKITLDSELTEDEFYLNHTKQSKVETDKISKFIDLFRQESQSNLKVKIESINHVPTAAGLASSASAYAALAGAANHAFGINMDLQRLSTFARRGSGSATRSLYGGFVEWEMGTENDSDSSFAKPVDDANWDIGMIVIAVNTDEKKISSRIGMKQTVESSPFYPAWVETASKDLEDIKTAIIEQNFIKLGEITESNSMKMHATMLGARPPISYWETDTIKAIQAVKKIREQGIPCYVTMDAGPNVKVLCKQSQINSILNELKSDFSDSQLIPSKVGTGIQMLSENDWNN